MNKRKAILLLGLIILGSVGGSYGTSMTLAFDLAGVVLGGLLGGLAYFYIDWAISRWRDRLQPEESMDEQEQVDDGVLTQSQEARLRWRNELAREYLRQWGSW